MQVTNSSLIIDYVDKSIERSDSGAITMEGDAIYFSRRASEERAAAMRAGHTAARQAHLDMAKRYEEFATPIDSGAHPDLARTG